MESLNVLSNYTPVKRLVKATTNIVDSSPLILRDMVELELVTRQVDVPMELDDQASLLEAALKTFEAMKQRNHNLNQAIISMHEILHGWDVSLDSTKVDLENMLVYIKSKMGKKRHSMLMSNFEVAFAAVEDDKQASDEEEDKQVSNEEEQVTEGKDVGKMLKTMTSDGIYYLPISSIDDAKILVAYYKQDKLDVANIKAPRGSPVGPTSNDYVFRRAIYQRAIVLSL